VAADLRVTDSDDIRRGYRFAALKNVILSPTIVVASAGNADAAGEAIRRIPEQPKRISDVLPILEVSSGTAGGGSAGVDYLLADSRLGIYRITDSGVEGPHAAAWIGDQGAFEVYQSGYHELPESRFEEVDPVSGRRSRVDEFTEFALRMGAGLERVIDDDRISSVGETSLSASTYADGFRYDPTMELSLEREQAISPEAAPVSWGTVAEGGFGYGTVLPVEAGVGVVGLFFPHAALGLLYHPLAGVEPFVYRSDSQRAFEDQVFADHGIRMKGAFGFGAFGR
jgi:hypothetical protein